MSVITAEQLPEDARYRLSRAYEVAGKSGRAVIESFGPDDYLGSGIEKTVFRYGNSKAIAFFPTSEVSSYPERLKKVYFLNKLAHLLLPNNIPDVHLLGTRPPMVILDRVDGEMPLHPSDWDKCGVIENAIEEKGLHCDSNSSNFIIDEQGTVHYIDSFYVDNASKLQKSIEGLDADKQKIAWRYFHKVKDKNKVDFV